MSSPANWVDATQQQQKAPSMLWVKGIQLKDSFGCMDN